MYNVGTLTWYEELRYEASNCIQYLNSISIESTISAHGDSLASELYSLFFKSLDTNLLCTYQRFLYNPETRSIANLSCFESVTDLGQCVQKFLILELSLFHVVVKKTFQEKTQIIVHSELNNIPDTLTF